LTTYYLEINATDPSNNNATATISITVVDTTDPLWSPAPSDQNAELGQPFSYDINATDFQAIFYYINDTVNFTININIGLIQNNTILSLTTYYLEINATDASNNNATAAITITVVDTTDPLWSPAPSDQSVELGQPFSYDVDATDLQIIQYYINDTVNFTININTGLIQNNTILSVKTYYLEINATDASNNNATATISITVVDTTD
ncbi:unnamed protein product, partial [marine sediment metagenome]